MTTTSKSGSSTNNQIAFESMTTRTTCRACGNSNLDSLLHFGEVPLAEVLLKEDQLGQQDARFPLHLVLCSTLSLIHISEPTRPY